MNATSLYVSTCRLVLQADTEDQSTWTDLYRLVPYLRQSLSCTVCGNLLIEPYTPTETNCQHHVCKSCKGGKKNLKPSCSWCKDYDKYVENVQLRILLQCYKKLCEYVTSTAIYRKLSSVTTNGGTCSLLDLIHEGTGFKDEFKSTAGLSKSAYSILPCVYTTTSTSTQTQIAAGTPPPTLDSPIKTVSNGSSLYSVMYASGNKITIKRKAPGDSPTNDFLESDVSFKKPKVKPPKPKTKKKGCRCGNATATPGKLTCCGQRCPCYVEAKACVECRCRGCRNPHRPGGKKVRPHIPELHSIQLHIPAPVHDTQNSTATVLQPQTYQFEPAPQLTDMTQTLNTAIPLQVLGVHTQLVRTSSLYNPTSTLNLQTVSSVVPAALLVGDEKSPSNSNSDNSDVDIDV